MSLKGSDHPFADVHLPWLPRSLEAWLHDVTYNEIHAAGLGLVGLVLAIAYNAGYTLESAGIALVLIGIAFGLRQTDADVPIARRVVKREPWYWLVVFAITYAGGIAHL